MATNQVSIKVGGEAGMGIMTIGSLMARTLQHAGLHVFSQSDYPSLIKGGHNTVTVRAEAEAIYSAVRLIDVLIALDKRTILEHYNERTEQGAIIYDSEKAELNHDEITRKDIILLGIPLKKIALEVGNKIYANTVALGAWAGLLQVDISNIETILKKQFAKKNATILHENMQAVKKGYDFICDQKPNFKHSVTNLKHQTMMFMNGNEAISIGAVKAGCKFYAAYPMTPASGILHNLAAWQDQYNIVVKHTEDEISAVNMACGAAFAGVRTMTGTSGGGFSLMVEGLGMAGMMELPIVLVNAQRASPSTGLPTYTEQGDLRFMLHAAQGDIPKIVLAPGDIEEAFFETFNAFNLAEQTQTPTIILTDKHLATLGMSIPEFKTDHLVINRGKLTKDPVPKRHLFTEDGVSPRPMPGQPGSLYVSSSYEHDETGMTDETSENHIKMMQKRMKKLDVIDRELIKPKVFGDENPDVTIVCWGSTKGAALDALSFLQKEGKKVQVVHYVYINPFPVEATKEILGKAKKILLLEGNYTGQFRGWLHEQTGIWIENAFLKYDGRPYFPEEIQEKVKEL